MRIDFHNLPLIIIGLFSGLFVAEPWGTILGLMMIGVVTQGRIITRGIDLSRNSSAKLYLIQNETLILLSCSSFILWKI